MVNRQRFLLDDLDSEGFPIQQASLAAINLGKTLDHAVPQAMLADHKCMRCANPLGWQEVDGVVLPRITWADENPHTTSVETKKAMAEFFLRDSEGDVL